MKVTVTGRIRGKARPRVYRGHAFTPIETKTYENIIRCAYQNQSNIYYEGAIKIKIDIYHKIPKSYTKKRVSDIREGKELPTKKPDIDNIVKIILDALNGLAYKDDTQVIELNVKKYYTEEEERIEFEINNVLEEE